jgi:glycerol-3-phosphate dehydrogenase (NAD(P)+)
MTFSRHQPSFSSLDQKIFPDFSSKNKHPQTFQPLSITVFGAGAFGSAMALWALKAGSWVTLWGRSQSSFLYTPQDLCSQQPHSSSLQALDQNTPKDLEKRLAYTMDLSQGLQNSLGLVCVPTQSLRSFLQTLHPFLESLKKHHSFSVLPTLIFTSKGIEEKTGSLPEEIITDLCPHIPYGFLSGPNLALEILQGIPSTTEIFLRHPESFPWVAQRLTSGDCLVRPAPSGLALQVSGAFKNILAIGMGFLDAHQAGFNTKASFFAQGFQDIVCFFQALQEQSLPSSPIKENGLVLSSDGTLGDLFLTCSSPQSRNYRFGHRLGIFLKDLHENPFSQGDCTSFFDHPTPLAEGFLSLEGTRKRLGILSIDLPTFQAVYGACSSLKVHHTPSNALKTFIKTFRERKPSPTS